MGPVHFPCAARHADSVGNSVVIADRNPMFLRGLASVWRVARTKLNVSCQSAFNFAPASRPRRITVSRPYALFPEFGAARHVFASATDAGRAFSMGASGVLPKDGAPQSLVRWLRQVMSGQLLVPLAVRNAQRSPMRGKPEELVIALTARERQIMELVLTGLSYREVGKRLHISEATIKVHLHHIFQKLSIRNRTALANIGRMRPQSPRPQNR